MKRNILILSLVAIFNLGCEKVDQLLTFSISNTANFTIESASPLNLPLDIGTPDVTTNSNQKFENNNTSAALVKDIRLQKLDMTITDPADKNFNFLKSIHVYISTDQQSEVELAYIDNVPLNTKVISLTATDQKLDAFVKSSSYNLRTKVVTDEALSNNVDIKMDLTFKVTAAPL